MAKIRIKAKTLTAVIVPVIAVLLGVLIAAHTIMHWQYNLVCQMFGYGEMVITKVPETEDLSAEYIDYDYDTADAAREHAEELTVTVEGEGAVLLENDGLLPLKGTEAAPKKVTLFGYKTTRMANSGTATSSFADAMKANKNFSVNPSTLELYEGKVSAEVPVASYTSGITSTYSGYSDAAIVSFGRVSGEGSDVSRDLGESEQHRHGLALTNAELDLLEHVCKNFDNVIVLINSDNTMELDFIKDRNKSGGYVNRYNNKTYDFSNIKAALWIGGVGKRGTEAVASILNGDVNPSGGLADTYVRDLMSMPSSQNFGDYTYTNVSKSDSRYNSNDDKFVEYEEGIYVGYRYYETAYSENKAGNYKDFDYDSEVLYPFGYGKSYSDFETSYVGEPVFDADKNTYAFNVKIDNKSSVAGKKAVKIFVHAPYVASSGIEVSEVVLGGFAKAEVPANGSVTVSVEVNMDYVIAYDYKVNKCYVRQAGDYDFYLSEDSHSWAGINSADKKWSVKLSEEIYNGNNKRKSDSVTAVNRFDDTTNYYFNGSDKRAVEFTRSDFKGTFPSSPVNLTAPQKAIDQLKKFDAANASDDSDPEPEYGNEIILKLIDLRGLDFDDGAWDMFMKQIPVNLLEQIYADGSFGERGDKNLGLDIPELVDLDGPYGFFGHATGLNLNNCVYYNSETVIASTWNVELAAAVGDAIAEEAANQNQKITGWYGNGMNTHRNPFCGRNQEYFSEDGLLAGKMSAAELGAASEKGLTTYAKHFALNDQETNRGGVLTWANEQAIREIYFRPFEIYIKEATREVKYYTKTGNGAYELVTKTMSGATGLMTAYSRIGAVWTGASEAFTEVLRDEWSFTGNICTDGGGGDSSYMNNGAGLYSGATTMMLAATTLTKSGGFNRSNTTISKLQEAVKYNLYNRVNSNIMQGIAPGSSISYKAAPWEKALIACWAIWAILAAAGVSVIVVFTVRDVKRKKARQAKKAAKSGMNS